MMALPVEAFRDQILDTVSKSATTIVVAETGAGKSTMVPIYLYEAGYRVVVTQPRILAARTVSARVASLLDVQLGTTVGYATGEGRRCRPDTAILFSTDGLQLIREVTGTRASGGETVLVLDEVHEWNTNMEVLVAWARLRQAQGESLKVVLMSATINAGALSDYFGGAPVIEVPGRGYPVERRTATSKDLVSATASLAEAGRNVLVFVPGKKEISETITQLSICTSALVLPLHGELSPEEQAQCFAPTPRAKVVVATNVAQTSVTIPDIDAVVDSGLERRIELRDGIEGLHLLPISRADCDQRAGRAGRTKPGIYILASDLPYEDRPPFPEAEILRTRLDQMVLRLACQGFDAVELVFFHQPPSEKIKSAKRTLGALGALTDEGVTAIGRQMSRLPLAVQLARMLVEAARLGVVEQVATVAACLEAGNILARDQKWRALTRESSSDLLALLDVFRAGRKLVAETRGPKGDALREKGIFVKDYFRAAELRTKILQVAPGSRLPPPEAETERAAVLQACVAGLVEHVYLRVGYGSYQNQADPSVRSLDKDSVVMNSPPVLVAFPFDLSGRDRRGHAYQLKLLNGASAVTVDLLRQVAPHLVTTKSENPNYVPYSDMVVSQTSVRVAGVVVESTTVDTPNHPEGPRLFREALAGSMLSLYTPAPKGLQEVVEANRKAVVRLRMFSTTDILTWLDQRLPASCARVADIPDIRVLLLEDSPEHQARACFEQWVQARKTDVFPGTEPVPDLREEVYGTDAGGQPMVAYGALYRDEYDSQYDAVWRDALAGAWRWYQSREEAARSHARYVGWLSEERKLVEGRAQLRELTAEFNGLAQLPAYSLVPAVLREQVQLIQYRRAYSGHELMGQVRELTALMERVKAKMGAIPVVRTGNLDLSLLAAKGLVRQKRK